MNRDYKMPAMELPKNFDALTQNQWDDIIYKNNNNKYEQFENVAIDAFAKLGLISRHHCFVHLPDWDIELIKWRLAHTFT